MSLRVLTLVPRELHDATDISHDAARPRCTWKNTHAQHNTNKGILHVCSYEASVVPSASGRKSLL